MHAALPELPAIHGAGIILPVPPGSPASYFRRNVALVVGVDSYAPGIAPLTTAVPDARAVARVLAQPQHGFEIELRVEGQATTKAVRDLLAAWRQELDEKDRVLIYVACHGISLPSDGVRPDGFLKLFDAVPGVRDTYLAMSDLYHDLVALPCRHLFLVLDCCFAGMFASQRDSGDPVPVYVERYDQFVTSRAWQVLASAAKDQRALDVETEHEGARAGHSPFAGAFLDALDGAADLDNNGLATATEVYWYVRNRVERRELEVARRQTPCLASLDKHEHGEFVFQVARELRLEEAPPLDPATNPYRGALAFDEDQARMFFGRSTEIAALLAMVTAPTRRITFVTGPAGVGKSSVVNAGLVPAVKGIAQWRVERLDARRDPRPPWPGVGDEPTLIVIDHLEDAAAGVAEVLATCWRALDERARLHVVVIARSQLAAALRADADAQGRAAGHMVIATPTRAGLRRALVNPARAVVMVFEPESFVDDVLDEVSALPAPLPVLSVALARLYEAYWRRERDSNRTDRALRQDEHRGAGAVVAELAAGALTGLTLDEVIVARSLLLRLFERHADGVKPRRVALDELRFGDGDACARVVQRLLRSHAVIVDTDEHGAYLEAQHASVLTWWRTQRDGREDAVPDLLPALVRAAEEWSEAGSARDARLWDDDPERLARARTLAELSAMVVRRERSFIAASMRRRRRRLVVRWGLGALVSVAAMVAIAIVVVQQRANVGIVHRARVAQAGEQFAAAKNFARAGDRDQAANSALDAVALAPDDDPLRPSYLSYALGLIAPSPTIAGRLPNAPHLAYGDVSADGSHVVARGSSGELRAWSGGPSWREVPLTITSPRQAIGPPVWSPTGDLIAASMGATTPDLDQVDALVVWDAEGRERMRYPIEQLSEQRSEPRQVTFCGPGCVAFVITCVRACDSAARTLVMLDVDHGRGSRLAQWTTGAEVRVGPRFAARYDEGGVSVVDLHATVANGTDAFRDAPHVSGPVSALAFATGGERIASLVRDSGGLRRLEWRRASDLTPLTAPVELVPWLQTDLAAEPTIAVADGRVPGVDLITVSGASGRTVVYEATAAGLLPISQFTGRVDVRAGGDTIVVRQRGTGGPDALTAFGWSGTEWYARSASIPLPARWVGSMLQADGILGIDSGGMVEHVAVEPRPDAAIARTVTGEPTSARYLDGDRVLIAGRVVDQTDNSGRTRFYLTAFDRGAPTWTGEVEALHETDVEPEWGIDVDGGAWWHREAVASDPPPVASTSCTCPDGPPSRWQVVLRRMSDGAELASAGWPCEALGTDVAVAIRDRRMCFSYVGSDDRAHERLRCVDLDTGRCGPTVDLPGEPTLVGLTADGRFATFALLGGIGAVPLVDDTPLPRGTWHAQYTPFFRADVLAAALAQARSLEVVPSANEPDTLASLVIQLPRGSLRVRNYSQAVRAGGQWLDAKLDAIAEHRTPLAFSDDGRLVAFHRAAARTTWRGARVGRAIEVFDVATGVPIMEQALPDVPVAARIADGALSIITRDGVERRWLLPRDPERHPWLRMLLPYGWPIRAMPGAEATLLETVGAAARRGDALAAALLPKLGPPVTGPR